MLRSSRQGRLSGWIVTCKDNCSGSHQDTKAQRTAMSFTPVILVSLCLSGRIERVLEE